MADNNNSNNKQNSSGKGKAQEEHQKIPPKDKRQEESEMDDGDEDAEPLDSLFHLHLLRYELVNTPEELHNEDRAKYLAQQITQTIKENNMTPFYKEHIKTVSNRAVANLVTITETEIDAMDRDNATELQNLQDRVKEAEEQFGESEVREALLAKAKHLHSIGDTEEALNAYRTVEEKSAGTAQKLDTLFARLRIALATTQLDVAKRYIDQTHTMLEGGGGDWERRNKLKVYEGIYFICVRNFASAAELLLDSVSTFSCHELMEYDAFAQYAVITAAVSLERPKIKKSIIDCPELLAVEAEQLRQREEEEKEKANTGSHNGRHAMECVRALYECRYSAFLVALAGLWGDMRRDLFLSAHARHYTREMRIRAYEQFLDPYKSVTMEAMAKNFNLSIDYIDSDLARFIAAGRLQCRIDRVGGVVHSNRVDERNVLYNRVIKTGDALIDRVQKISRVIEM